MFEVVKPGDVTRPSAKGCPALEGRTAAGGLVHPGVRRQGRKLERAPPLDGGRGVGADSLR